MSISITKDLLKKRNKELTTNKVVWFKISLPNKEYQFKRVTGRENILLFKQMHNLK